MAASGDLSIEAQERYAFVEDLLEADFPPPARIVELGSAPGDQIAQLARRGYIATSVDLGESQDAWADGREGRMDRVLADAGVESVMWNLEDVPYPIPDESFQAVIMTEVFEHLREYPVRSLEEIRRMLAPGGRLYFTTPNAAYVMNRFRLLQGRSVATPLPDWIAGVPHARHAREYTFDEVDTLMDHAGLRVIARYGRHFHLNSGRSDAASRLAKKAISQLSRARPTLGPSVVVIAERPLEP